MHGAGVLGARWRPMCGRCCVRGGVRCCQILVRIGLETFKAVFAAKIIGHTAVLVRARGGLRINLHATHRIGDLRRGVMIAVVTGMLPVMVVGVMMMCFAHKRFLSVYSVMVEV